MGAERSCRFCDKEAAARWETVDGWIDLCADHADYNAIVGVSEIPTLDFEHGALKPGA